MNGITQYSNGTNSSVFKQQEPNGTLTLVNNEENENKYLSADDDDSGGHQALFTLEIVVVISLTISLVFVLVLGGLLYRFRNRKVIKAGSPVLLHICLLGATLQYVSCYLSMSNKQPVICCIIAQWLQLTGFTFMYGALGLKTWRISVILHFYKSRQLYTKNRGLIIRLITMVTVVLTYLIVWTSISLHRRHLHDDVVTTDWCGYTSWGHNVVYTGECSLLIWCAVMCYKAKRAPNLYNDSVCLGMAMNNHIVWIINYVLSRYYLETYHSALWSLLLTFVYIQVPVTTTLVLAFLPKFSAILYKIRVVHGTLTDVYGPARIHKLTLVLNKTGSVCTISCAPCGPLQDVGDDCSQHTETSDIRETRETEYSKDEVNSLIELVSKLKSEKQQYKTQLQALIADVKNLKKHYSDLNNYSDTHTGVNQYNRISTPAWPVTPLLPNTPGALTDNYNLLNLAQRRDDSLLSPSLSIPGVETQLSALSSINHSSRQSDKLADSYTANNCMENGGELNNERPSSWFTNMLNSSIVEDVNSDFTNSSSTDYLLQNIMPDYDNNIHVSNLKDSTVAPKIVKKTCNNTYNTDSDNGNLLTTTRSLLSPLSPNSYTENTSLGTHNINHLASASHGSRNNQPGIVKHINPFNNYQLLPLELHHLEGALSNTVINSKQQRNINYPLKHFCLEHGLTHGNGNSSNAQCLCSKDNKIVISRDCDEPSLTIPTNGFQNGNILYPKTNNTIVPRPNTLTIGTCNSNINYYHRGIHTPSANTYTKKTNFIFYI